MISNIREESGKKKLSKPVIQYRKLHGDIECYTISQWTHLVWSYSRQNPLNLAEGPISHPPPDWVKDLESKSLVKSDLVGLLQELNKTSKTGVRQEKGTSLVGDTTEQPSFHAGLSGDASAQSGIKGILHRSEMTGAGSKDELVAKATENDLRTATPEECAGHTTNRKGLPAHRALFILCFLSAVSATGLHVVARLLQLLLDCLCHVPLCKNLCRGSATWHVLHRKCDEISFWPLALMHFPSASPEDHAARQSSSIVRHSIWACLLVDSFFGLALCLPLWFHRNQVAARLASSTSYATNKWLHASIAVLMNEPAGLKLNTELANLLGSASWQCVQLWAWCGGQLAPYLPLALATLSTVIAAFGLSVVAAVLADAVVIAALPVVALYRAMGLVYSSQMKIITSLWHLFMGRRWNALQERVDSFSCASERLALGSLLFTVALLLLPTTALFYLLFASLFLTAQTTRTSLLLASSICRSCPWYTLVLRLLCPLQLPSGLYFDVPEKLFGCGKSAEPFECVEGEIVGNASPLLLHKDVDTKPTQGPWEKDNCKLANTGHQEACKGRCWKGWWLQEVAKEGREVKQAAGSCCPSWYREMWAKDDSPVFSGDAVKLKTKPASIGQVLAPLWQSLYYGFDGNGLTMVMDLIAGRRLRWSFSYHDMDALPSISLNCVKYFRECRLAFLSLL